MSSIQKNSCLGFDTLTTQKSWYLSKKYYKVIEEKLNFVTSTPVCKTYFHNIMDVSLTAHFEGLGKCQSNISSIIDSDSGYVSTNQESFLTFPLENMDSSASFSATKQIYLSEDALLEQPEVKKKEEFDYSLSDSVIPPSFESEKTTFSGFDESSCSEHSSLIPLQNTLNSSCDTTRSIDNNSDSLIQCSQNTNCDMNLTDTSENLETIDVNLKAESSKNIEGHLYFEEALLNTPPKKFVNVVNTDLSPDLFSDDESKSFKEEPKLEPLVMPKEKYVHKNDHRLISRVNAALSGLFPPHSFTVVRLSIDEILNRIDSNKHLFYTSTNLGVSNRQNEMDADNYNTETLNHFKTSSLLITGSAKASIDKEWPFIMESRYYGLHHNRSKLSEEFEHLCIKYAQRYISCETQSTCTVFENNAGSPSKRKATKRWNVKSPGRRLSHLARRKITFNNSVLQTSSSSVCSRAKQILVDARRLELLSRKRSPYKKKSPRKTPKKSPRRTPRKSPRIKGSTPSSSAKKRLALKFRMYSENEESIPSTSSSGSFRASVTKRALFQSPNRGGSSFASSTSLGGTRKNTPKRALFVSPDKSSPSKAGSIFDKKRKRSDSIGDIQPSKFPRSMSVDIHPTGSEVHKKTIQRRQSECLNSAPKAGELSEHHKKKLQWAVYEALRSRNVGVSHPQFKTFAATLARVTRRFLPNLSAHTPRPEGGTSERMLKIARQHVFAVINGKTVDEIIHEAELNSLRFRKLTGYVSAEEISKTDVAFVRNKENILQDRSNIMNSQDKKTKNEVGKLRGRGETELNRIRKVIDFGEDLGSSSVR